MKCEICQQRSASLHLTNFINGQKTEIHLCQQCAKEKGYLDTEEDVYTIHDLLSGLFNDYSSSTTKTEANKHNPHELACPHCHMTYQQFSKIGKFGCSQCYQIFSEYLNPIFRRVQGGNTKHIGKIPNRQHVHLQHKRLIQDYRDQLQQLINEERFEDAAEVRDKIKELEQKEKSSHEKGDEI
ncbi:UvrB/UvrC motif-containing protein [Amphibacillus sp. Q70]|uniref:UvrB/UvrC motif-containing protein n=1 Tax=Amphibacillus sp. Q70 TaxID=3453416 RepID=UPI003F8342A7